MLRNWRQRNNDLMRMSWLIFPLILIGVGLYFWAGEDEQKISSLSMMIESTPQGQFLTLVVSPGYKPQGSWQQEFIPVSESARQQTLQILSRIRADYKQLNPTLKIWTQGNFPVQEQFARQLSEALSLYNLGQLGPQLAPPDLPEGLDPQLVISGPKKDKDILIKLMSAVSPYFSGKVYVLFDDNIRADELRFYVLGVPYFDENGHASFRGQAGVNGS